MSASFKSLVLIAAAATLTACVQPTPPPNLLGMSDLQVCQEFARARSAGDSVGARLAMTVLDSRNALTAAEKHDIQNEVIRTNMREHAAICSWGPYLRANASTGTFGRHVQFVVGRFGPYIYTENGRVRSWQSQI